MRLLVTCAGCRRQYNAAGQQPGTVFRCHCGSEVVVAAPRGHDAAVVRCSSCGAPREGQADACRHCGADFTIHELDLHTVCPACFARVSDRARYCHHCATPLVADLVAGEPTEYGCPVCGAERTLVNRRIRGVTATVFECRKCAGLWIGLESFRAVLDTEAARPASPVVAHPTADRPPSRPRYRPCVVCRKLMTPRNFGLGQSGVIVDLCGDHGIWFDAHEFAHTIAWIRAGGLEAARRDLARLKSSTDVVRKRQMNREPARTPAAAIGATPECNETMVTAATVIEGLFQILSIGLH